MVPAPPHITLDICFNYTHLSTLMGDATPPYYTQSLYFSLQPRARPIPRLIHLSFFKQARHNLRRWTRYRCIKVTFSFAPLVTKCFGNIMVFSSHLLRTWGVDGSLRWGKGLLITCSYRGLIVISSFLSYSFWLCSPSCWSRPAERYRRWMPTRGWDGKDWKSPKLLSRGVKHTVQGRLF